MVRITYRVCSFGSSRRNPYNSFGHPASASFSPRIYILRVKPYISPRACPQSPLASYSTPHFPSIGRCGVVEVSSFLRRERRPCQPSIPRTDVNRRCFLVKEAPSTTREEERERGEMRRERRRTSTFLKHDPVSSSSTIVVVLSYYPPTPAPWLEICCKAGRRTSDQVNRSAIGS